MPLDEERKKRLQRQGMILDSPEMDEMMAPFREPVETPPGTPLRGPYTKPVEPTPATPGEPMGPTRETFEEKRGPKHATAYKETESYQDLKSMFDGIMPERKEDLEKYHKRSARYDALGRAIGSLGGFVSAHMGGPVAPATPGRSREHMDRYEQLLLDYEEKKRAHDLLTTQEILRDKMKWEDVQREDELRKKTWEREDERREEDLELRETELEERREHEREMLGRRTKEQIKLADHQHNLQKALAGREAKYAAGTARPHDYRLNLKGTSYGLNEEDAIAAVHRLPKNIREKYFGIDPFDPNMSNYDTRMKSALAESPHEIFIRKPVYNEDNQIVGERLAIRTRAPEVPDKKEVAEKLLGFAYQLRNGMISMDDLYKEHGVGALQEFVDETFGYNEALEDIDEIAKVLAQGIKQFSTGTSENILSDVPFFEDWRAPSGYTTKERTPEGLIKGLYEPLGKNLYDLMRYYDIKAAEEEAKGDRVPSRAAEAMPGHPYGGRPVGRAVRGTTY